MNYVHWITFAFLFWATVVCSSPYTENTFLTTSQEENSTFSSESYTKYRTSVGEEDLPTIKKEPISTHERDTTSTWKTDSTFPEDSSSRYSISTLKNSSVYNLENSSYSTLSKNFTSTHQETIPPESREPTTSTLPGDSNFKYKENLILEVNEFIPTTTGPNVSITALPKYSTSTLAPIPPGPPQQVIAASTLSNENTSNISEDPTSTELPFTTEFPLVQCEEALPKCQCFDYDVVAGVYCPSITDFSAHKLVEPFEANTTFEVTLAGGGVLGRRVLEGLIVFRLFLDGVDKVEEGAFDGVFRLRRFHARMSRLTEIPDFRPIRHSLRNVHLDNGQLTSVEGEGLTDLPLLDTLSMVNNSISYVNPLAFQGTSNLVILDLSRNHLLSLPPDIFNPLSKLKKVVLSRNRLLHVDSLFATVQPKFIYLDYNQLTDADSVLHPGMTEVETIQLSHNPLGRVSNASFNGRVNSVRFLFLDHCNISRFDPRHYANLSQLATLDLSYNVIEEIGHQIVDFGYNIELDLTGNRIREFNAELSYHVRRVFLAGNQLTSLGSTLHYSQMTEVSLADNRISRVAVADVVGAHGVQVLELQGNGLAEVEPGALDPIRRDLVHLDLSRNRLRSLDGCLKLMSALASLNLTQNMLESFGESDFLGLNELTELYVAHNLITTLSEQLKLLPQLQYIVVTHNRIRTIRTEHIPKNLRYLYLAGNPLRCDCELLPFLEHLNSTSGTETDVPVCLPSDSKTVDCPRPCSCACANSKYGEYYIEVNCMNRNLSEIPQLFPNATTEGLLTLVLPRRSHERGPFVLSDEVGSFDLSNNRLSSVEEKQLPKSLRRVRLNGYIRVDRNRVDRMDFAIRELDILVFDRTGFQPNGVWTEWISPYSFST